MAVAAGGGRAFRGKAESGKENPYSCCVLAGARSMHDRRKALQVFQWFGASVGVAPMIRSSCTICSDLSPHC